MSVGFVLLVHDPLDRAADVARHLAEAGAPVVVHVDARAPRRTFEAFRDKLSGLPTVRLAHRRACRWGTWSIVEATRDASRLLLDAFPDTRHVFLACGTALPLRPVADLRAFLAAHPETDFIESVTTEDVAWTVGGLDRERFTLSFPFAWKSQRARFDLWVSIQRRLGLRRAIPEGIEPHLGSQWWCLTRETLQRIMSDPDDARLVRYFRKVWIPDESYFQTLVRRHARRIESRSLTFARFDVQGRPHVFYDDHLDLLSQSGSFMARKIWPQAEELYRHFLSPDCASADARPDPAHVERVFARALERRTRGRPGLYMQSRFPRGGGENRRSAAPYFIYEGFGDLVEDWADWLGQLPNVRVHGHLYAPDRAEFADGQMEFAGALSDIATLRDYNPVAFLTNLVWNTRGERQCFSFGPADNQEITGFVASDPNARISVVSGAWMVRLLAEDLPPRDLRRRAAALQAVEAAHLETLRDTRTQARVRIWTLADFLEAPEEALRIVRDDLGDGFDAAPGAPPRMRDLGDLAGLVRSLRDEGMPAHVVGDIARLAAPAPTVPGRLVL
jgi:hypothetical protein